MSDSIKLRVLIPFVPPGFSYRELVQRRGRYVLVEKHDILRNGDVIELDDDYRAWFAEHVPDMDFDVWLAGKTRVIARARGGAGQVAMRVGARERVNRRPSYGAIRDGADGQAESVAVFTASDDRDER